MAIDKIFNNSSIDDLADNVLSEVDDFMLSVEKMQKRKVAGNVQLVIQALKKIDADIREKYDGVTTVIEKRVSTIKDGKDGQNGKDGRDGKDGRNGKDGLVGPRGMDGARGMDGRDGDDGVSVTNAFIDFDGSLVINLSDGQSLNVGEVVAPDLAEKIKVITNGGGTSQGVLDTLTSLQNQINLISSALVYKGTWNASTNTPALASGVGTANSFYIVSVAGTTTLDGISNWGVGDWATFNGTAWQRVEGGAAGNFTDLTASGAVTLSGGTANGVAFLNGSKVLSSSGFFTYDDTNGISLLRPLNQGAATSFTSGTTSIGSSSGTSTANPFFQFQGRNDWPLPQILRFQADYVSGADSGMGLTISSRISNGTFQNRYRLLADGTAHIWSLGATGAEKMRLNSTGLEVTGTAAISGAVTLSGGTANGVAYLNGSKVLTTGSALTFDGTDFRMPSGGSMLIGASVAGASLLLINGTAAAQRLVLGTSGTDAVINATRTSGTTPNLIFQQESSELMRLTSTGLGIGTSSPQWKLDVQTTQSRFQVRDGANTGGTSAGTGLVSINATATALDSFNYRATVHAFIIDSAEAMRLDSSGNLGIGTSSPAYKLDVSANTADGTTGYAAAFYASKGAAGDSFLLVGGKRSDSLGSGVLTVLDARSGFGNGTFGFYTEGTERMRLDSSGNLGLGVTPSTWSLFKALEIGNVGTYISGRPSGNQLNLGVNTYYNSGSKYANSGVAATLYEQEAGAHKWYTAPSGTAGNAISFTQALTLDASGNLMAGVTSTSFRINATVASGADRDIFAAQISGASNGLTVKWNHATTTTRINISNLPTSATGLASGDLYVLAGALMVA